LEEHKNLKVIISGGGSGGHIFPAIAIAQSLQKQVPNVELLFVGAKGRMEMQKIPDAGYKIEGLWISGLQRKLTFGNLAFPFKVLSSLFKARGIVKKFRPDLAIGVGGYASGPLLQAASWSGVPSLIQEQNSYPGITNKILSKTVQKICVAYDGLGKFFPAEKIIMTGNPVRSAIVESSFDKQEGIKDFGLIENKKTVFVTGGSLGARGINEGVKACLSYFKEKDVQVIWQTGKFYFEEIKKEIGMDDPNIKIMPFVKRMDLAYAAADVIIARAGALTISELCIAGKPVVFMPSPNVTEDHQTHNAMALVDKDAALMMRDKEAKENLPSLIANLLEDEKLQQKLTKNIKGLAVANAADVIAKEALMLLK